MSTLPEDVKRRIVVELASFRTTLEVAVMLMQEYELEVRPNDLCRYDATKDYFAGGVALAELFHATRRKFVHEVADIPIAHQAYRLRLLQRLSERAERKGDFRLAAKLIEQAAKEVGGYNGKARQANARTAPVEQLSASEARERIVAYLKSGMGQKLWREAAAEAKAAALAEARAEARAEAKAEAAAAAAPEGEPAEPMAPDGAGRPSPAGARDEAEGQPAAPIGSSAMRRLPPYIEEELERRRAAAAATSAAAPPDREARARTG